MDTCFEKEECRISIPFGYCNVKYDCQEGKCYHELIRCPEICYGGKDEDYDTLIDCEDPDCVDTIYCPCERADYNHCAPGLCYCSDGSPKWIIYEDKSNTCICG